MTPDEAHGPSEGAEPAAGEQGVFGSLPRERPSMRGRSRSEPARAGRGTPAPSAAARRPDSGPRRPVPEPAAGAPSPRVTHPQQGGGLGDLAWAGVAVAAQAATAGVRLTSRALEALRRGG